MQLGAAKPRRQIDINLIPREFRRRQFPILTAGLSLVLIGCLLLIYGIFYLKTYSDLEILAFRSLIPPAQEAVRSATANEEAAGQSSQRYAGQASDHRVLAERQILWSKVVQAVSSPPAGVKVREIGQAGYTVSIIGSAPEFSQAVKFLEGLRATDLFSNSSIQLIDSSLLTGTPTPRASFGTPTPVPPVAVVPLIPTPTATIPYTRTPTATPTATFTPNAAATAAVKAQWTAAARSQATAAAKSQKTATALARIANRPTATATRTRTATPITTMVLSIAASQLTEPQGTTSGDGHGPAQAVDGNVSTGWAPISATGSSGRWLRIDLRSSALYAPATDVIWSIKIIPYRLPVSGPLPTSSTGRYFVYTYTPSSTTPTKRCDRTTVNWAQTAADPCWSAASNHNLPLTNVSMIAIGIPSSNPTDTNWLQGIAEIEIEVNQRGPVGSGPLGFGSTDAAETSSTTTEPTLLDTPSPSQPATPTSTVGPFVGSPDPTTPTPTVTPFGSPASPQPTPAFGQSTTPVAGASPGARGPAEFLILLEVKPGEGYK